VSRHTTEPKLNANEEVEDSGDAARALNALLRRDMARSSHVEPLGVEIDCRLPLGDQTLAASRTQQLPA